MQVLRVMTHMAPVMSGKEGYIAGICSSGCVMERHNNSLTCSSRG